MTHSTEEMILAAHVRSLALQLWEQAFKDAQAVWRQSQPVAPQPDRFLSRETYKAQISAVKESEPKREAEERDFARLWVMQHPLAEFIPTALQQLTETADLVKQLRS